LWGGRAGGGDAGLVEFEKNPLVTGSHRKGGTDFQEERKPSWQKKVKESNGKTGGYQKRNWQAREKRGFRRSHIDRKRQKKKCHP